MGADFFRQIRRTLAFGDDHLRDQNGCGNHGPGTGIRHRRAGQAC
jgi:hypothetical protein